jgi:hypothetical protein
MAAMTDSVRTVSDHRAERLVGAAMGLWSV